jgi:serine/threonine-protein kinase
MSDVFVSYKAEDRRRVKPLVEALQADGYSVWWDEQIGGGAAWRHAIESELNAAKCVIVVWSNRSVGPEGTFVQDEATRAQQRQVYVPVLIDKVHLPLGFGETQALPLVGWKGNRGDARYEAVLAAIQRNVGVAREATAIVPSHSAIDRRTAIAVGGVAAAAVAGIGAWTLLKPSVSAAANVAVLPFANLSGDPAQGYFSDGVAEEIRSALARIAGLKVVGRTSSEAVRNDDAETAAKKLGVANILTGSVRQSPSTIRVSAELIDGRSGIDKWSQDYDRSPGDSIKIQTDIAENVASALSVALGSVGRAAIDLGGTENPQAQNLYLHAIDLFSRNTRQTFLQGMAILGQAIAIDPRYASAYASKSFATRIFADGYAATPADTWKGRADALRLANTAIQLSPNFEKGYRARAEVYKSQLRISAAWAEFKRALQLAPNNASTLRDYSAFLSLLGLTSQALPMAEQAIALDPLNSDALANRITILFQARRYGDAIEESNRIRRDSPNLFDWPGLLGEVYAAAGKFDDARKYLAESEPDSWHRLAFEAVVAARQGDRATALARVQRLKQLFADGASYQFAEIHAQLGEKDAAFDALDHAWQIKDGGLVALRIDPWVDPLRGDTRFTDLIRKAGFPA